jgi:hypothetical protein
MAKRTTIKEIGETLEFIVKHMVTKEEMRDLRADLKADIADIRATMATKDDIRSIHAELTDIRRNLKDLQDRVNNLTGVTKEIDHALARIRRIEKHLGIEADIPA